MVDGPGVFHPRDAIKEGTNLAIFGGSGGLLVAAIQNAMAKQNVGAMGVFRNSGHLITALAGTFGVIGFTATAVGNIRQKHDYWSTAAGGFAGGCIQGLIRKSIPRMIGFGTLFAVILGVNEYTGGIAVRLRPDPSEDRYELLERMRKNRRRPIEETLSEIGEGRGIYPPGYEERRRARLKEKYGIEVHTVSAEAVDSE